MGLSSKAWWRSASEDRFFTPKEQALILCVAVSIVAGALCLIWFGKDASPRTSGNRTSSEGYAIDINTASVSELESLPGIGPKLAAAIVRYRSAAPFRSIEDLGRVPGVGPKKLEVIRSHVTVSKRKPEDAGPRPKGQGG